jgi:predicted alpha/beta hydrolase family esterase
MAFADHSEKILVLPGLNGSLDGHWQRHWLEDYPHSEIVEQQDWSKPDVEQWVKAVEKRIDELGTAVYIIGHSLGSILGAHLSNSRIAPKIKGAMLVAPCDLDIVAQMHPSSVEFGKQPDWNIRFPSLLIGSEDDHYMPLERLHETSALWNAELASLGSAGHINIVSGFGRWPEGYRYFERLRERVNAEA